MFCVECGKEGELYQSLCVECFLGKNVFITIPKQIDTEVCAHCGAWRRGKSWVSYEGEKLIEEIVIENAKRHKDVDGLDVHISSEFEDENRVKVKVITHANVLGLKTEEKHETRIRYKKIVCDGCSKQHGGYWEAKVQLRGSKRGLSDDDLEKALELVDILLGGRGKKDKGSFITKIEKIHNGLDFYFGSKSLGKVISKKLASGFGGEVKESHKLMGRKDGKDIYRTTYAVRARGYRAGDFVELDGRVSRVLSLSTNKVLLSALDTGKNISLRIEGLKEAKLLGGNEIIKDMVVVSKSENEIQVLDPDTLKTVEVVLPEDFEVRGESVRVVKSDAGYFLVDDQ